MKSIVQEDETSHGGLSIGKLPQRAILGRINKATCQSILHQQHGGNLIQAKDVRFVPWSEGEAPFPRPIREPMMLEQFLPPG
jgi:hypothetical protein